MIFLQMKARDRGVFLKSKILTQRTVLFATALFCFGFVVLFSYVPLFGWIYSFFDYKPGLSLGKSKFVGLKYFVLAFSEPELLPVLRNTLAMSFLGLAVTPIPVLFAILLNEMKSKWHQKLIQTTTTLPNFISWVLVYSIFFTFFSTDDGFVNSVLLKAGILKEPTSILSNGDIVWFFQTAIGLWKGLGFGAIIYLAAIAGVDTQLYDAAQVDGAGRFRTILHITIPSLMPTYITLLLLNIGALLSNGFEQYYVFYNPMVHEKIQVLDYYLYRIGIAQNDYSFSTALGMSKTIISVILMFTANWISKRVRGQSIV